MVRISVFILFCFQFSRAQNLIPDSSFENNKFVPLDFSAINASRFWNKPSLGTSDLFCKCGKKQRKYSLVNVPNNPMGNQLPRSGSCYAGLFAFSHGSYREYIYTALRMPLEKNKYYQFKMYISLADYSRAAIDQLGVCFVINQAKYKHTGIITNLRPVYMKIENKSRTDTSNWQNLSVIYKSVGDESYIIIGSFKINEIEKTKVKAPKEAKSRINQMSERDAYYFIDDVSLVEVRDTILINQLNYSDIIKTETNVDTASHVHLIPKNILFESNKSGLPFTSFLVLDEVAAYLKNNQEFCIEISGHTDNVGKENQNQSLSEKRARAVWDYLISNGIDKKRISYKGYGGSKPIAKNDTEEGREQNRRVAFVVIDK